MKRRLVAISSALVVVVIVACNGGSDPTRIVTALPPTATAQPIPTALPLDDVLKGVLSQLPMGYGFRSPEEFAASLPGSVGINIPVRVQIHPDFVDQTAPLLKAFLLEVGRRVLSERGMSFSLMIPIDRLVELASIPGLTRIDAVRPATPAYPISP